MSRNYRPSRATPKLIHQLRYSPLKGNKEQHHSEVTSSSHSNNIFMNSIQGIMGVYSNLIGRNSPNYPFLTENDHDTNTNDSPTETETKSNHQSPLTLTSDVDDTAPLYDEDTLHHKVQAIVKMDDEKVPKNTDLVDTTDPFYQYINDYINQNKADHNDRKRSRSPEDKDLNNESMKRQRVDKGDINAHYVKPIGVVRSKRPKVRSTLTAPFKEGLAMICAESASLHKADTEYASLHKGNCRKRAFREIEVESDHESIDEMAMEPQHKRIKLIAMTSREDTPILSQETAESEAETVSRRQFRPNRIKCSVGNKVSTCCRIAVLTKQKERYLRVYERRLRRIYSKYNIKNETKISEWIDKFGGDIDKLHVLYEKVCGKYDLLSCAKYEGYEECPVPEDEEEQQKHLYIKGIPINVEPEANIEANANKEDKESEPAQLTMENVNRHSYDERNYNDNQSETSSVSTFNTPRKQDDQISQRSDTLPSLIIATPNNSFFNTNRAQTKPSMPQTIITKEDENSREFAQSTLNISQQFVFDSHFTNESDIPMIIPTHNNNNVNNMRDSAMMFNIPNNLPNTDNMNNMNNMRPNNNGDWMQRSPQIQFNFKPWNRNDNEMNAVPYRNDAPQWNTRSNNNYNMNSIKNDGSFFQSKKGRSGRPIFRAKKGRK